MFHIAGFSPNGTANEVDEIEIIHDRWVLPKKNLCFYPPFMRRQLKKALKSGMEPNKNWKVYHIRILKSYDSYEEAWEKLAVAEITSNLDKGNSEMEESSRRKRRKTYRRKDMELESDSDEDISSLNSKQKRLDLPLHPEITDFTPVNESDVQSQDIMDLTSLVQQHKNSRQCTSQNLSVNSQTQAISNSLLRGSSSSCRNQPVSLQASTTSKSRLPASSSQSIPVNSQASSSHDFLLPDTPQKTAEVTSFEERVLKWMEMTEARLKENTAMLANIVHCLQNKSGYGEYVELPDLPLTSQEEMAQFEEYIQNSENFDKMVKYLSQQGGQDISHITKRILKALMTLELATEYNWAGRGEKIPLKDTKFKQLIIYSVRATRNGKNAEQKDIEENMKNFLKYAPLRVKYAENKKKNENFILST